MDGYCRLIDLTTEEVHVGYFQGDMPKGKYARYNINGQLQEEGIKEEDELVKEIEINHFMTRILDTKRDKIQDSLLNPDAMSLKKKVKSKAKAKAKK